VLEDILNTHQRPKQEDYGDYLYIVLQAFVLEGDGTVANEQVSLIVGDGYVLSFQESGRDIFRTVRERINGAKGRIRREGADYLAYSLLDTWWTIISWFSKHWGSGWRVSKRRWWPGPTGRAAGYQQTQAGDAVFSAKRCGRSGRSSARSAGGVAVA
jgi:hypothetical protein